MQRQVGHYIISYYVPSALLVGSLNRHLIHHPMWRSNRWTIIRCLNELLCTYTYVEWYLGVYEICIHPGVYEHGELLVGAKRSAWSGDFGHLHLAHSHHSHSEVNFSNKQTWTQNHIFAHPLYTWRYTFQTNVHTTQFLKKTTNKSTSTWLTLITLTQRWTFK